MIYRAWRTYNNSLASQPSIPEVRNCEVWSKRRREDLCPDGQSEYVFQEPKFRGLEDALAVDCGGRSSVASSHTIEGWTAYSRISLALKVENSSIILHPDRTSCQLDLSSNVTSSIPHAQTGPSGCSAGTYGRFLCAGEVECDSGGTIAAEKVTTVYCIRSISQPRLHLQISNLHQTMRAINKHVWFRFDGLWLALSGGCMEIRLCGDICR